MSLLFDILFVYFSVVFSTTAVHLKKNLFTATDESQTEVSPAINDDLKQYISKLEEYIHLGEYDENFIVLINEYETMNNNKIVFSPEEINILTNENDDEDSLVSQQLAQLKYFRKMQDIQCTSYVILYYMHPHLKYNVERLLIKDGDDKPRNIINKIKKFVYYNMISILFDAKYVVPNWLWDLYIKLMALSNWRHTIKLLKKEMFEFEKLKIILDQLIEQCSSNNYLVKDYIISYNLTKGEEDFDYLLNEIVETYSLRGSTGYDDDTNEYFGIQRLYLQNLWDEDDYIFINIYGVKINWDVTKEIFNKKKNKVKPHFENGEWITNPFKYIKFQNMFLDIIKVNLLCFMWVHIYLYQKLVNNEIELWQYDTFLKKTILHSLKVIEYEDESLDKFISILIDLQEFTPIELNIIISDIETEVNSTISKLNVMDHKSEYRWAYIDYDDKVFNFETQKLYVNVWENKLNEPYAENYENIEWVTNETISDENENQSSTDVKEPHEEEILSRTDDDEMTIEQVTNKNILDETENQSGTDVTENQLETVIKEPHEEETFLSRLDDEMTIERVTNKNILGENENQSETDVTENQLETDIKEPHEEETFLSRLDDEMTIEQVTNKNILDENENQLETDIKEPHEEETFLSRLDDEMTIEQVTNKNIFDENENQSGTDITENQSGTDIKEPHEEETLTCTDDDEMIRLINTEIEGELFSETGDESTDNQTGDDCLSVVIDTSMNCSISAADHYVHRFLVTNARNMWSYVNFLDDKMSPVTFSDLIYFASANKNTNDIFIPNN